MRSVIFNIGFALISVFFVLLSALMCLFPSQKPLLWAVKRYCKRMVGLMRLCGIDVSANGHDNIPEGPAIIASKHQSYGDGFVLMEQVEDLSFVTGDHITKFPFISAILKKLNAIIVSSCGGEDVKEQMRKTSKIIHEQGRKLLIFPEGHLSEVGTYHTYKRGVYHLYKELNCPVVPVAQNLGQRWNQMDLKKYKGKAKFQFLPAIEPGLGKKDFMDKLETMIEEETRKLLDIKDLGALNPKLIGTKSENKAAKAARLKKEANKNNGHNKPQEKAT